MSTVKSKSKAWVAIALTTASLTMQPQVFAQETSAPVNDNFSSSYTALTKKILMSGIELERFSLNYRLQSCHQSTPLKLVFFGAQEAGAATGLAFEIMGNQQFDRGRHKLLKINQHSLQHGLRTAEVGSIIAASGSGIMLAANAVKYARDKHKGFDAKTANRFVSSKLEQIDKLLAEREALVAANKQSPAYDRAVLEGKILHSMRGAFVDEYAHFNSGARSSFAVANLFYLLNASYNTLGAVAAGVGYNSVNKPKLNGPSNILFTITGAMATAAPLLCSAQLWAERRILLHSLQKKWNGTEDDLSKFGKDIAEMGTMTGDQGALMPGLPATKRFALYTESNQQFTRQLESELTTMARLNKVALQNSVMGPAIGGLLMSQGILGTRGYYKYFPSRPKTQLDLDYKGSVCGTVGTSMAVVGNAAWLLASLSYEHKLRKRGKLPEQLIKERLGHLDDLEKVVSAL